MQLFIGMLSISLWDLIKMQLLVCNDIILVPWDQVWSPELTAHMLRP